MPSLDLAGKVLTLRLQPMARRRGEAASPKDRMSGFFDVYSIIFLIIAVVIFMRLGSVLGRRTGNEPTPYEPRVKPPAARGTTMSSRCPARDRASTATAEAPDLEPLAPMPRAGTPLHDGLVAIAKDDPDFDPEHFIAGAKAAYEMIVTAFAQGDRATLKNLLAPGRL